MADVKTLTVHGIPYSIKDETARKNIGTLQSTVSGHTSDISDIEGNVSALQSKVSTLQSTVSGHTGSISQNTSDINTIESEIENANNRINNLYPFYNLLMNPNFSYNRRDSGQYTNAGYTKDMWYADGTNPNVTGGSSSSVTISAGTRLRQKFMDPEATLSNNLTVLIQTPTAKVTKPITVPFSGTIGEFMVNVTSDHEFNILSTTGATISWVGLYVGHYNNVDFTYLNAIEQLKLQKYIVEIRGLFDLFTSWGNSRMSVLNLRIPLAVPIYYTDNNDISIYVNFLNDTLYGEESAGTNDVQMSNVNNPVVADNGGTNLGINFTKKDSSDFGTSHYWADGHIICYAEPKF